MHIHTCTHTYPSTQAYTQKYASTQTHTHTHARAHTHTHTHKHTHELVNYTEADQRCSLRKAVLRNIARFTGKHLSVPGSLF